MEGKKGRAGQIRSAKYLGDFILDSYRFEKLDERLAPLQTKEFASCNHKEKSEQVNRALLECLSDAPKQVFALGAVVEFVDQIAKRNILIQYTLSSFELWLNQFSNLSNKENYQVRSKIVGKSIPRDDYQLLFPVGMGKVHPGSHFVTAHASPDLDTTVASFWGWVDAFGARVSEGIHVWNVPGGPPPSSIEVAILFHHIFGQNVFSYLAKTRSTLSLSSLELMTQRGVVKQTTNQSALFIDHARTQKAVILIDEKGYFLGDWRSFDVEGVRQVIMLLSNCLRFFENHLHMEIISLFAKQDLKKEDLAPFIDKVFALKIKDCQPVSEFAEKQVRYMDGFLSKVLMIPQGMESTFFVFASAMKAIGLGQFQECIDHIVSLSSSDLFDFDGKLVEDRPKIFNHLEKIISLLDRAIQSIRLHIERLDVALDIKTKVFGYLPQVISYRADVDEIKMKIGNYPYLTVTSSNDQGQMIPLGVVRSSDLGQPILATVTLRDFCNRDETKIPPYFEVISVIDHHKTTLQTSATPVVYISDAQASNAIVASVAFVINDKYSTLGMELSQIEEQIKQMEGKSSEGSKRRLLQRLLVRQHAAIETKGTNDWIDPLREFVEYLHFLYAILDDTDLLTKVSHKDVDCVASILNRLRSLMDGKEVEIIHFEDLTRDETFVEKAANRILRHPDMYSLYRKIYVAKERLIEENLEACRKQQPSDFFVDTKLQNRCARVGQTKMFATNYDSFIQSRKEIVELWVKGASDYFTGHREFDLHLHMISTVAGAEDLFSGQEIPCEHKDELWIWIPMTEQSIQHLKGFLSEFRASSQIQMMADKIEVEIEGGEEGQRKELAKIFGESFLPVVPKIEAGKDLLVAVIRYRAGAINSRKAMISPYLPKVLY